MKAFKIFEHAHRSKIPLTHDAADPVLEKDTDSLLIDVYSAGLKFFDPPFPFILGTEFAGTVAVAPAGSPFKKGDRVFGSAQGSLAERLVATPELVLPLPDSLSFDQGAGLVGRAAKVAARFSCWLAADGVGIAAIQISKALCARVRRSPNKLEIARVAGGAYVVVDYTSEGWQKYVMHITGGRGIDVVYDPVGRIKVYTVAWGGRALVVGFAGGAIEQNVSVVGIFWGSYTSKSPKRFAEVWQELLGLLASGKLKPILFTGKYTLDTLGKGLDDLKHRRTWGKAVANIMHR